jgi:hypothetical protein
MTTFGAPPAERCTAQQRVEGRGAGALVQARPCELRSRAWLRDSETLPRE